MTVLNLQVGASFDDVWEQVSNGAMSITGQWQIGDRQAHAGDHGGLRFTGISGLSGATVSAAPLTFRAHLSDSGAFVGDWFAEDAEAPPTFTSTNSDLSNRTRTTTTVEGDGSDFGNWTSGQDHTFTDDGVNDILDIIQELANSYNPSAIVMLHIYTSGVGERVAKSYDDDTALAPKLDITFTTAGPTAALTGTALPTATEVEIAAGGETVIITLTDDTWLDAGGAFDGSRQAIIDGFDAAASPALGWNDEVRDKAPVSAVVRTSSTVATITWTSAASAYDISSNETITVTIPAAALTTSADPITADETFDVTVVAVGGRVMSSLVGAGGLAGTGGIAGKGGGLAA